MATNNDEIKDPQVLAMSGQGVKIQASLKRLTRYTASFEVYMPETVLRVSEVFSAFKIVRQNRTIYSGSAVILSLVDVGSMLICEAKLEDASWTDVDLGQPEHLPEMLQAGFQNFVGEWNGFYQVLPEFKIAVADLQSFLDALRLWLDQVELGIRTLPSAARLLAEQKIIRELMASAGSGMGAMFERFEQVCATVPAELIPAHRAFCRRQLHPLLLCCPFMYRIFAKPLGYAGDYEMMNMIVRNDNEGGSLFAKLLQAYILNQAPAIAVRNRVDYFAKKFVEETMRVSASGRITNICSIGCGPAREVEKFMTEQALSNHAQFRLVDFNDETLNYTSNRMEEVRKQHHRRTPFKLVKKPAQFLFKETGGSALGSDSFDLIYCSGLYDYLNDRMIKELNTRLYDRLRPGGALIVTNFDPYNPIRHIMEFVFDWFLIHRDGRQLAALAPSQALEDHSGVIAEASGCNIFLETRKPC